MAGRAKTSSALRVGLLGLGTVGSGVAEILERHADLIAERTGVRLALTRALVRNPRRKRAGAAGRVAVTREARQVVEAPDVDIVVELLGGLSPAQELILAALRAGKSVVTANKAVLAKHGDRLFEAAARGGVDVYFEAAVAGGIPIIRTLREGLAGDRITRITGILNGTTNYIISQLEAGNAYADALAEAQRLGYAEADPTLDVNGRDAADKLAILTQLAFGTAVRPDKLPCVGVTALTPEVLADARQLGCRVKLLATAARVGDRCDVSVAPTLLPERHVLSHVPANQNAIAVESDALGMTLYQGAGAGSLPTGSAVVADLIEAGRNLKAGVSGRLSHGRARSAPPLLPPAASQSAYYMRLAVDDRPGVLASVAKILATHRISLASVLQRESGKSPVPLVLTTHVTDAGAMHKAVRAIGKLRAVHGDVHVLRLWHDAEVAAPRLL
jgi:homoserine dehydrogenase